VILVGFFALGVLNFPEVSASNIIFWQFIAKTMLSV